MNGNNCLYGRAGLWASGALLGVLTGCTTYVEAPRPAPVYVAPPPPAEVAVTPPSEAPGPEQTVLEIRTERDFYEPLSPYGHWVDTADYGRCWVPDRVDRGWRPYSNGYWRYTEAGWYWVSDEPWGWATYHYGRWDWKPEFGWVWVPQTQWAPAWVSFHQGGGYTGWAPLYPSARIRDGGLEEPVGTDRERGLVFVEQRRFLEPVRPNTVVVNNTTIINQTVNITSIKVVNNKIINEGPRLAVIEKASGRTVEAVPVRELRRKQEAAVVAARPIPSANQNGRSAAGRLANESSDNKTHIEAERRAADAQAETQRKAKEIEARTTQSEAPRRASAANSQAQAETQRKAREAELNGAQAPTEGRGKAKEAELRTAQAEAERRTYEAKGKALPASQSPPAARGEDAITSHIAAAFAADPGLRGVHVVRSNGVVHLIGPVSSADQKKRAGDLAQKIETTHRVQNDLTVRH